MKNFMVERLTVDAGKEFAPSRYSLKSGNDSIVSPYATYDLFFEMTFHVLQKLGAYEDIGTPEECRKTMEESKAIEWVEVTQHETTEEDGIDKERFPLTLDCKMPDDGQEILVTLDNGSVDTDICIAEGCEYATEKGWVWGEDIIAWAPWPRGYKREKNL